LVVAGPLDLGQKDPELLAFKNPDEALAGFKGQRGVRLRIVRTTDGQTVSEYPLNHGLPVFDGLSAANGRLYLATASGKVVCLSE
jgi:hypothetical protein